MKKVPCLICQTICNTTGKNVVAIVCNQCQKTEDIDKFLKQLNLSKVKKVLNLSNGILQVNEYGEVIREGRD